MSNIYEITGNIKLFQALVEDGEVDEDVIADTFESLEGEFDYKVEGYCKVRSNMLGWKAGLLEEMKRLQSRVDSIDKNLDRMERTVQKSMLAIGREQVETKLYKVKLKRNPPSVVIDHEELVPPEFMRIPEPKPPKPAADKTMIKAAMLEAGITENEYAHIERKMKLDIK